MRSVLAFLLLAGAAFGGPPAVPRDAVAARRLRRARLARYLGKDYALLLGQPLTDTLQPRQEGHFLYLTGVEDPAASLLLAGAAAPAFQPPGPDAPAPTREILFLRGGKPKFARFFGLRHLPGAQAASDLGIATALPAPRGGKGLAGSLAALLPDGARLHLPRYGRRDHATVREIRTALIDALAQSRPDLEIVDLQKELGSMRGVKDAYEIETLGRSIAVTLAAFRDALPQIEPGSSEAAVDGALLFGVRRRGALPAYTFVVGSGLNATVPHYFQNSGPLEAGALLVIDAGAAVDRYAADITRTFPVSGTFTARQREVYQAVLAAQRAGIAAIRPGATLRSVDTAARNVLKRAKLAQYFIHSTSHHVGLDVHDPGPAQLAAGMTITVEPGVYIPDEKLGIRIEDVVLVTKTGRRVLSQDFPKDPDAIERLLKSR